MIFPQAECAEPPGACLEDAVQLGWIEVKPWGKIWEKYEKIGI
jgi:hypothetical protein